MRKPYCAESVGAQSNDLDRIACAGADVSHSTDCYPWQRVKMVPFASANTPLPGNDIENVANSLLLVAVSDGGTICVCKNITFTTIARQRDMGRLVSWPLLGTNCLGTCDA